MPPPLCREKVFTTIENMTEEPKVNEISYVRQTFAYSAAGLKTVNLPSMWRVVIKEMNCCL